MTTTKMDWYTPLSQEFMGRGYFHNNATIEDRIQAIADLVGDTYQSEELREKVKDYIERGYYVLPSPVWSNANTGRGSGISCFNTHISDSIESIIRANSEVGMLCKIGGGTSGYFGELRPAGSPISSGGETFGAVHFMQMFDTTKNVISQNNVRRGEFAAYLDITHGDIKDFLRINGEGHKLQRFPFGVCVPDKWIEEMKAGDMEKRELWAMVLDSRNRTGFPYIFFTDNVNNNTVDVYKDKKARVRSSNMCVTADQLVVTGNGLRTVADLYNSGEELVLFDGDKVVTASPMRLIEKNVPVFTITTKEGRTHTVTDYHKVMTDKGMVECKDLKPGDRVKIQRQEGLFGSIHRPELAFLYGMYQGDGTQTETEVHIDVWKNDFDLLDKVKHCMDTVYEQEGWMSYDVKNQHGDAVGTRAATLPKFKAQSTSDSDVDKNRISSSKLKQLGFSKEYIPSWILQSDRETQAEFLKGLYFTDGTATLTKGVFNNPINLSLTSTRLQILQTVQIMLSNFGINSKIYNQASAGLRRLPDGKGSTKEYMCNQTWRLNITSKNDAIKFNTLTGFLNRKSVVLEKDSYRDNSKKYDTIVSIHQTGTEDVYCTTVNSEEHAWVCNSFVTSNCTEILLPSTEEETFVCDLVGMNLVKFDEWKDTDAVRIAVYIADAVLEEFIRNYQHVPFIERAVRFATRHRAIGIGASGYHSYLQSKMIAFESMEAKMVNVQIFKTIQEQAWAASKEMAEKFGEPEMLIGYGRRHTTLTAVAPNTSSSFIMGQQSQSIEPYTSNYYIKKTAKVKHAVKNPYLKNLLEEKGHDTFEVWESILQKGGSVEHLHFLSEHEKIVFRTFAEISQMEIVIQASARQKFIDQGQSLNLMIHPSTPTKDVNTLLLKAHELGVKTLYYQLGQNAAQEFARDILSCESCAG